VENAEQELTLRRLRRVRLAIRVLVFGGLALALVLAFAATRREARGTTGIAFLDGETSQGHAFELMLRDGRPAFLKTRFDAPCDGEPWQTGWRAREGREVTFRFEDDILTVSSSWAARFDDPRWSGRHSVNLRAQLDHGIRVRGHMALVGRLRGPYGPYACESGAVTFAAG
jgi:hypothetical protein